MEVTTGNRAGGEWLQDFFAGDPGGEGARREANERGICVRPGKLHRGSMKRREFLAGASAAVLASWLTGKAGAQVPAARTAAQAGVAEPVTQFRALRRNVGYFTGRGGTIGWLASKGGLVVVDTQFPDTASTCLAGLPERGTRLIDAVINTHHHADHTSGNGVFKGAAQTIVAQANVPKLQFRAAERAEGDPNASSWAQLTQQVYADTTFPEVWRQEIGDEVVTAQFHGAAHTGGDATVTFERANVVHLGDLVFNRLYPVIDRAGGATIRGWIRVLEEVQRDYPADAIYVFGHGSKGFGVTGKRTDIGVFRDYLSALLEHVQKEIAAGKTKEEIVTLENFPGFPDLHTPRPNRLGGNLAAAYDELMEAGKG